MSVTFTCPEAPRRQFPCRYCAEMPSGEKCEPWCLGYTSESEAPEANFANGNATGLLALLGLPDTELYGDLDVTGLADLRRRILKARNGDRTHLVREPYEVPGGWAGTKVVTDDGTARIQRMGPRTLYGGNTDEQTLRRLDDIERLVVWAQNHELGISWG